jgi:Trk-type K+ transport system membrane component
MSLLAEFVRWLAVTLMIAGNVCFIWYFRLAPEIKQGALGKKINRWWIQMTLAAFVLLLTGIAAGLFEAV